MSAAHVCSRMRLTGLIRAVKASLFLEPSCWRSTATRRGTGDRAPRRSGCGGDRHGHARSGPGRRSRAGARTGARRPAPPRACRRCPRALCRRTSSCRCLRAGAAHPAATTPASLARPVDGSRAGRGRADGRRACGVAHGARGDARAAVRASAGRRRARSHRLRPRGHRDRCAAAAIERSPRTCGAARSTARRRRPRSALDRSIYSRTTEPLAGHPHPAVVELDV